MSGLSHGHFDGVAASCQRADGVAAPGQRLDAIDATTVSVTRRDGPDAVRIGSNLDQRPPTSS